MRVVLVCAVVLGVAGCSGKDEFGKNESVGACDTSATNAWCVEHGPGSDPVASQQYCAGQGGQWVASCPTTNVVARCDWPSSVQYFYAGSTDLAGAKYQCDIYGRWHEY